MGYHLDASADQKTVPIHDHKLTIKGRKTLEVHSDMLQTGQLRSHDSSSPYYFLNHTPIGSKYPEEGYDAFFAFDHTGEQVRLYRLFFWILSVDHIQYRT
jgi:hypothetical protein